MVFCSLIRIFARKKKKTIDMELRKFTFIVLTAVVVMVFAGCSQGNGQGNDDAVSDSLRTDRADNAIIAATNAGDLDRASFLIDSFLEQGDITLSRAYMRRVVVNSRKGDSDGCYEDLKKVIERFSQTGEDPRVYVVSAISLSSYYMATERYEEALRLAVPAINTLEQRADIPTDRKVSLLNIIGNCQMKLKLTDDGEKNFEKSYQFVKKYLTEDYQVLAVQDIVTGLANTAGHYIDSSKSEKYWKWTERADSMLAFYKAIPDANANFADRMEGRISLQKAKMFQDIGKEAEAAKAFEQFEKTDYAKTDDARYNSLSYLANMRRYDACADILKDMDRMMEEWGEEMNLDAIAKYLTTKFRYNYLAGRKDTALAVALRIDSLLQPAIEAQKENEAAELATIYETQKKEAQIAQQQMELSQQRLWGAMIVFGLIVLFMIIYLLYYRHAQKRVARLRAAQERIESELQIARDIQMSMVPSIFPEREGLDMYASMTPAKEVGGDLYGYLLMGDKLYFAVGDVSGKGVPASLFMAQATRLFLTLAKQGMMPADICTRMNDALSGNDNENGMFVTFWLGLVDLQTGHLNFCNAGHNPPVIMEDGRRKMDDHVRYMEMIPNAPIGLWPGLEYEGEEIESIKGCPLFIYTDGLNEAENRQKEQFGDERLLDILRNTHFNTAQQVIEVLKAEVETHRNGAEPNDDLTMMCLQVK